MPRASNASCRRVAHEQPAQASAYGAMHVLQCGELLLDTLACADAALAALPTVTKSYAPSFIHALT
jgi:hypothetical protein